MDAYSFQVEIKEPVYNMIFFNHPLLKTNSNKEHDNAKIHPPNIESIEQLVEKLFNLFLCEDFPP